MKSVKSVKLFILKFMLNSFSMLISDKSVRYKLVHIYVIKFRVIREWSKVMELS